MAGYNHFENSLVMGTLGLVTTSFYTFLPCFLFILDGAPFIERTKVNNSIKNSLSIVTAAVVGVVLNLTIYLGMAVINPDGSLTQLNYFSLVWTIISLLALYRFKVNMISWIAVSAVAGSIVYLVG